MIEDSAALPSNVDAVALSADIWSGQVTGDVGS